MRKNMSSNPIPLAQEAGQAEEGGAAAGHPGLVVGARLNRGSEKTEDPEDDLKHEPRDGESGGAAEVADAYRCVKVALSGILRKWLIRFGVPGRFQAMFGHGGEDRFGGDPN